MVQTFSRWLSPCAGRSAFIAVLWASALAAQAQPAAPTTRPDPLDPKANVPALTYESSFGQYRKLGDEKRLSWREANDTVARIGGWRVYAREAQQPDAAAPAKPGEPAATAKPAPPTSAVPPADKPMPMPAGHGGHKMP